MLMWAEMVDRDIGGEPVRPDMMARLGEMLFAWVDDGTHEIPFPQFAFSPGTVATGVPI